MRYCDKTAVDPAKHVGPFTVHTPPYVYDDAGQKFESIKCAACGNTVVRKLSKCRETATEIEWHLGPFEQSPQGRHVYRVAGKGSFELLKCAACGARVYRQISPESDPKKPD